MSAEKPNRGKAAAKPADARALMAKNPAATPEEVTEEPAAGDLFATAARKAAHQDAEQEKAEQLGIRPPAPAGAPAPRPSNLRRSSHALQLFSLMLVITLLLFGALLLGLYSFYHSRVESRLAALTQAAAAPSPQPAVPAVPTAVKIELPSEFTTELAAATAKLSELQKQIDVLRETDASVDGRLKELATQMTQPSSATPAATASGVPAVGSETPPSETEPPVLVAPTSASNKELVLLKERNRLTAFADEAIATGSRKALNAIIERLQDPEYANLRHAAFAEVQRVYYHLRFTTRINPGFRIPVNEMFKEPGLRDETDLKTDRLIKLMQDQKQPWEVRLRAAYLLGGRRTREVGEALIKSIKDDPVLDVAKEAQLSLEQSMDQKFLLLDLPAIEQWWKTQTVFGEQEPKEKAGDDKGAPPLPEKAPEAGPASGKK